MSDHLFVYGSLLSGLASPALAHLMNQLTYLGPAKSPGLLYDIGAFPGAVPDAQSPDFVHGELYVIPKDVAIFSMLDHFEGHFHDRPNSSLFRRTRVNVTRADGRVVVAWMYAWNRVTNGARTIASGDYRAARAAERTTG